MLRLPLLAHFVQQLAGLFHLCGTSEWEKRCGTGIYFMLAKHFLKIFCKSEVAACHLPRSSTRQWHVGFEWVSPNTGLRWSTYSCRWATVLLASTLSVCICLVHGCSYSVAVFIIHSQAKLAHDVFTHVSADPMLTLFCHPHCQLHCRFAQMAFSSYVELPCGAWKTSTASFWQWVVVWWPSTMRRSLKCKTNARLSCVTALHVEQVNWVFTSLSQLLQGS